MLASTKKVALTKETIVHTFTCSNSQHGFILTITATLAEQKMLK